MSKQLASQAAFLFLESGKAPFHTGWCRGHFGARRSAESIPTGPGPVAVVWRLGCVAQLDLVVAVVKTYAARRVGQLAKRLRAWIIRGRGRCGTGLRGPATCARNAGFARSRLVG
jgi:hypothetical protein